MTNSLSTPTKHQWWLWFVVIGGLIVATLAALGGWALWVIKEAEDKPPRFVPNPAIAEGKSFSMVLFDFLNAMPVQDGLIWVGAVEQPSNFYRAYLVEVETGAVRGALEHADALMLTADGKSVLAGTRVNRTAISTIQKVRAFFRPGSLNGPQDDVAYWLVPLDGGPAQWLAGDKEWSGAGSTGQPSPGRHNFSHCLISGANFVLDVETRRRIDLPAAQIQYSAWWSDSEVLLKNGAGDLIIVDLNAGQKTMMTLEDLAALLAGQNLAASDPSSIFFWPVWNGREYTLYLTSGQRMTAAGENWVLELERETESLRVVARQFAFERLGRWDESQRWYVYPGKINAGDSNAVYVRDMATSSVATLIPPDPQANYYSLPVFAGEWILYVQNNAVWRMRRDGTEKRQLFPPVDE